MYRLLGNSANENANSTAEFLIRVSNPQWSAPFAFHSISKLFFCMPASCWQTNQPSYSQDQDFKVTPINYQILCLVFILSLCHCQPTCLVNWMHLYRVFFLSLLNSKWLICGNRQRLYKDAKRKYKGRYNLTGKTTGKQSDWKMQLFTGSNPHEC